MIARHEVDGQNSDIWAQLAAPLPENVKEWRQDGRPTMRDGKFFARFVVYIEANTVRERLDAVVPGGWDLTLELLPAVAQDEPSSETVAAFKARLQVLGVIREDVGHGRDYKQAATDAFKRAAVRFGIGHELYSYDQNWVQVDGDSKFSKPVEDPGEAYARRQSRNGNGASHESAPRTTAPNARPAASADVSQPQTGPRAVDEPACPKCGGRLWDNRISKRNPRAPDWKCRSRSCDGVIWPAKTGAQASTDDDPPPDESQMDNRLPF